MLQSMTNYEKQEQKFTMETVKILYGGKIYA